MAKNNLMEAIRRRLSGGRKMKQLPTSASKPLKPLDRSMIGRASTWTAEERAALATEYLDDNGNFRPGLTNREKITTAVDIAEGQRQRKKKAARHGR